MDRNTEIAIENMDRARAMLQYIADSTSARVLDVHAMHTSGQPSIHVANVVDVIVIAAGCGTSELTIEQHPQPDYATVVAVINGCRVFSVCILKAATDVSSI